MLVAGAGGAAKLGNVPRPCLADGESSSSLIDKFLLASIARSSSTLAATLCNKSFAALGFVKIKLFRFDIGPDSGRLPRKDKLLFGPTATGNTGAD